MNESADAGAGVDANAGVGAHEFHWCRLRNRVRVVEAPGRSAVSGSMDRVERACEILQVMVGCSTWLKHRLSSTRSCLQSGIARR